MKKSYFDKCDPIVYKETPEAVETTGYDSILFLLIKTGSTTIKAQDSDDGSNFADVDAKYVIDGTKSDNGTYKLEYIGTKKYVKIALSAHDKCHVSGFKIAKVHQA